MYHTLEIERKEERKKRIEITKVNMWRKTDKDVDKYILKQFNKNKKSMSSLHRYSSVS
jgi:hypothetical protein